MIVNKKKDIQRNKINTKYSNSSRDIQRLTSF